KQKRKDERRAVAEKETIAALEGMLANGDVASLGFRARLYWLKVKWGWRVLQMKKEGDSFAVEGAMSPGKRLVGSIVDNLKVLSFGETLVKGGGRARLIIGEEQTKAPETIQGAAEARSKESGGFRLQKWDKPAWLELEEAAKAQYHQITSKAEG